MLKDLCSHRERSIAWFGFCMEVVWQSVMSGALVNGRGVASLQVFGSWAVHAAQRWQLQWEEEERCTDVFLVLSFLSIP